AVRPRSREGAARRTVQCDRGTLDGGLAANWSGIRAIGRFRGAQWRKLVFETVRIDGDLDSFYFQL
ncbi:hypothetical protein ACS2RH_27220, partial [Bacillus cereus group sp. BC88]|uniref:hypothetical protein n=1 Tax=Bacillus cereus group sp. BC88 TaxID=3445265 RepID=UPI003F28C38B